MPRDDALRVLHLLDHSVPHHSGYSFRTLNILRGQRQFGWQTFHLTTPKQGGNTLEDEAEGFHFFRTVGSQWAARGFHEFGLMRDVKARLLEVAARVRPHVLHVHSPVLNALPALSVARQLKVPLVYEVRAFWEDAAVDHGSTTEGSLRYRLTRALETYALKHAQHVTTICQGLAADIRARGVAADKITVIPNGVDVSAFAPGGVPDEALRGALGLAGKTVLGFIGSFYAYEGLPLLIEALSRVRRVFPDVAVLLAGGGPQDRALRAMVGARGLADSVVFAGRVGHEVVQRYYDLIDVLVYPRLPMRLTELVTPMKPLEAMAQGRLLLASDVGGHRELIDHARTGWLFEAGSVEALANGLIGLLRTRSSWPAVRCAARAHVEARRTWAHSVAPYRPVFEAFYRAGL